MASLTGKPFMVLNHGIKIAELKFISLTVLRLSAAMNSITLYTVMRVRKEDAGEVMKKFGTHQFCHSSFVLELVVKRSLGVCN